MNLRFAICDDEKAETSYLSGVLQAWATAEKLAADISVFDSAEAFLSSHESGGTFDVLLLDIQMSGLDGVSLAKKLRAGGSQSQIIFITGYPDFMSSGYDVSALHYLMKPVDEQKLREVLSKAANSLLSRRASIIITTDNGSQLVYLDDIRYIEVLNHEITADLGTSRVTARMSLTQLLPELDGAFFRCHRSFIVGLKHINRITKTEVILDDGRNIPLSRRLYGEMYSAFIRYYKGEA